MAHQRISGSGSAGEISSSVIEKKERRRQAAENEIKRHQYIMATMAAKKIIRRSGVINIIKHGGIIRRHGIIGI